MKAAPLLTLLALLGLAGCTATDPPAQKAPTGMDTAPSETSAAPPTTATGEPFSLYTHCGFSTAVYADQDWVAVAVTPPPALADPPDATGLATYDGYTDGTMTLVSDSLLRFVVTDRTAADVGLTVDFVPAAAPPTSWCE
jgi:hypothetical protein